MAATTSFELRDSSERSRVVRGRVRLSGLASGPQPAVLLVHGFKGFMDWGFFPELARRLADGGLASIAFNASGSGIGADLESFTEDEAFAKDTFTRQLEDLERVREEIAREAHGIDPTRVGLFGHSRGGAIALLHAAERGDYRAVATWSAVPSFDRFDEATKELWRRQGFIWIPNARLKRDHRLDVDVLLDYEAHRQRLDLTAACARLRTPALLVHGSADETVEPEALQILAGALPRGLARTELVQGANHTFGATHPLRHTTPELERALTTTVEFFRAQGLGSAPASTLQG
jgi:uncharacterized protein